MKRRSAFTIVELLVSMALIIFIMVILSNAFIIGTDTFRRLKAVGDMQEKLRSTTVILQADLTAPHFSSDLTGTPAPQVRLSNIYLSNLTPPAVLPSNMPALAQFGPPGPPPPGSSTLPAIQGGFFRIWQGLAGSTTEGFDASFPGDVGLASYSAYQNMLHFTVCKPSQRPESYFLASAAGTPLAGLTDPADFADTNSYKSRWAEVVYFLQPVVDAAGNPVTANGTQLFALYRRQILLVPPSPTTTTTLNTPPPGGTGTVYNAAITPITYYDLSVKANPAMPGFAFFNGPGDVTVPENRFGTLQLAGTAGTPTNNTAPLPGVPSYATYPTLKSTLPAGSAQIGDDLLLTDVVSFAIRVRYDQITPAGGGAATITSGTDFTDLPATGNNLVFNGGTGLPPVRVFDTWSQAQWMAPTATMITYDYVGPTPATPVWATAGSGYSLPLNIIVRGVQITIRIWDSKSEQTRQITIVQDM